MKVVWEEKDIRCGRRVKNKDGKETCMLIYGYINNTQVYGLLEEKDGYANFSYAAKEPTKVALASFLTERQLFPVEILI